jgi:hypothetical protein
MKLRTLLREAGYFALFVALLVNAAIFWAWWGGFFDPSLGYSPETMQTMVWVNPWGVLALTAGWCTVRGWFILARRVRS